MKIINMSSFIIGITNIVLALLLTIIVIVKPNEAHKIIIALGCLFIGIMTLLESIETKKQRQRYLSELQEKAKFYGWDKED